MNTLKRINSQQNFKKKYVPIGSGGVSDISKLK
jgi:hypothetical protein